MSLHTHVVAATTCSRVA